MTQSPATANAISPPRRRTGSYILLVILTFILYGSTVLNDYALDDGVVFSENTYTLKGVAGIPDILTHDSFEGFTRESGGQLEGGRYRPLSLVTFALEVSLFGRNHPSISHLINVLLFALTIVLFFQLLLKLFPPDAGKPQWTSIAFLSSLIFLAHPIHTEVVANIKGRDEILGMLFVLIAMRTGFRFLETSRVPSLLLSVVCFYLALLSKESMLPVVIMIPLTGWLFFKAPVKRQLSLGLTLLATALLYLVQRSSALPDNTQVVSEILNNPYDGASVAEKIATSLFCLLQDIRLLIFPHPLTHDYYPFQIAITSFGNPVVLLSLLGHLALLIAGIVMTLRKKPIGWAILWYLICMSIVSNFFVNTGTFMAERFLYLPSAGFAVLLAILLSSGAKRLAALLKMPAPYGLLAGATGLILVAYSIATEIRNPAWKNNFTLFTTDIEHSPKSARAQALTGGAFLTEARKEPNSNRRRFLMDESLKHLDEALRLYPTYATAWIFKGNLLLARDNDTANAAACFQHALAKQEIREARNNLNLLTGVTVAPAASTLEELIEYTENVPGDARGWMNLGLAYEKERRFSDARKAMEKAIEIRPDYTAAHAELGMILGPQLGDFDGCISHLSTALSLPGGQVEFVYNNLGIAYGQKRDYKNSERVLNEGLVVFPDSPVLLQTLAATYEYQGDLTKAAELMDKVNALRH